MATTVQQAAANALAAFLEDQLEDVEVLPRWPEPDQDLPDRAVSVLLAGRRQDEHWQAEVVNVEGTGASRTFHWKVKAVEQPVQLDVWARYDAQRDDILAQLDDALHQGTATTLNAPFGSPTRDGPLLALDADDGHEGYVDFTFEGAFNNDTPDAHTRAEYRATINGAATMSLVVKTQHPLLQVAGLLITYGEVPSEHAQETIDIPVSVEE
jgi:hypothetical protein